MLIILYIISYLFIGLLICACVAGAVRIVRVFRVGQKFNAWPVLLSELRLGLILAGFIIIVATHAHGTRVAQVLLMIMLLLGVPNSIRVLSGYGSRPKPLP